MSDQRKKWIEVVTGPLDQKKAYRQAKKRIDSLPQPYRSAAQAFNRYVAYGGGVTDGDTIVAMWADLADMWERAALDGTPVREVVTDDPVGFAESYVDAYGGKRWIDKERERFTTAIDDAEREQS